MKVVTWNKPSNCNLSADDQKSKSWNIIVVLPRVTTLGLQPRDMAAMLDDNTTEFLLEEFTWKES